MALKGRMSSALRGLRCNALLDPLVATRHSSYCFTPLSLSADSWWNVIRHLPLRLTHTELARTWLGASFPSIVQCWIASYVIIAVSLFAMITLNFSSL